jgi:hypothetical protein
VTSTFHIVVAMKPLEGNFTQNALRHGVAGINVDGCRIRTVGNEDLGDPHRFYGADKSTRTEWNRPHMADAELMEMKHLASHDKMKELGRWPANVILEDNDEIVAEFPSPLPQGGVHKKSVGKIINNNVFGKGFKRTDDAFYGDSGSASRFFKQVKEE